MSFIKLKDLYVAKLLTDTTTTTTYEAPSKIDGLMSLSFTPQVDTQPSYADDTVYEINESFTQTDVELVLNGISTANYAKLLGKTVGASGVVQDSANDESPYFAIGFRAGKSKKAGGGDVLVWFYKGKFIQPSGEHASKGAGADSINQTLSGTFIKRDSDDLWKVFVDTDDAGLGATVVSDWFTTVFQETP